MSLPRTMTRAILPLSRGSIARPTFCIKPSVANPLLLNHRLFSIAPKPKPKPEENEEPFQDIDTSLKGKDADATPPMLSRPIGMDHPPRPDENTGIDTRTWAERRDDFKNWDKHLEKREKMTKQIFRPYFHDLTRLSTTHKGKSFLSPPLLFRSTKSLFFPNLVGRTLLHPTDPLQNTTSTLEGHVSVVSVFSSAWAEAQVRTFTSGLEDQYDECVRRVDINVETNVLKAWLIRAFVGRIRKGMSEDVWGRYFLVQRGLDEEVRARMAYANEKVGYVYLVDWDCRIRWAGSGRASEEERMALRRGVVKLREEWKKMEEEREEARVERERVEREKRRVQEAMDEI